jgi:hypothetical protein
VLFAAVETALVGLTVATFFSSSSSGTVIRLGCIFLLSALFYWPVFAKVDDGVLEGWRSIVPVLNAFGLLRAAAKPGWWIVLMCIPIVNFVVRFIVIMAIAENFGRSEGFGAGMFFLPFVFCPILGFGPDHWEDPEAEWVPSPSDLSVAMKRADVSIGGANTCPTCGAHAPVGILHCRSCGSYLAGSGRGQ